MEMVFFQFWVIKGNVYIDGPTIIIVCLWRDISLAIVDVHFYFLRKVLTQFLYAYINKHIGVAVTIYDSLSLIHLFTILVWDIVNCCQPRVFSQNDTKTYSRKSIVSLEKILRLSCANTHYIQPFLLFLLYSIVLSFKKLRFFKLRLKTTKNRLHFLCSCLDAINQDLYNRKQSGTRMYKM